MTTNITIDIPEVALFDAQELKLQLCTYIRSLAAKMNKGIESASTEEVCQQQDDIVSSAILDHCVSVQDARQQLLDMVHAHFHPAVSV